MKRFVNLVEKYLIRFIIFGLVALVVVQGIMTRDDLRLYLSLGERLEGQNLQQPVVNQNEAPTSKAQESSQKQVQVQSPHALVTISLEKFSSLPKAFILINDRKAVEFNEKEVKLDLAAGDIVEIDATYYNFPVSFKITDVTANIAHPQKNQIYQANQGIVMVGKVIVK